MKKYEVRIVFGNPFLNETGKSVFGDGKTRMVILNGENDNEALCVASANVEFGVDFKPSPLLAGVYTYDISTRCTLILHVK